MNKGISPEHDEGHRGDEEDLAVALYRQMSNRSTPTVREAAEALRLNPEVTALLAHRVVLEALLRGVEARGRGW